MSKSKGNGIDPLTVMDAFGADALRFAMAYTSTGGQDIRWDDRRVEMGRNFTNKLWNATRFAMMNLADGMPDTHNVKPETLADRWILSRLQRAVEEVTRHLDAFDLGAATRAAYEFIWSEFCDWYLEVAKPKLYESNAVTKVVLARTLTDILKLLHPLIPFITSELYEALGFETQLGWASWPQVDKELLDADAERDFIRLQNAVTGVRNLRAEANVPPSQEISVSVSGAGAEALQANPAVFKALTRANVLDTAVEGASLSQVVPELELTLPLTGLVRYRRVAGAARKTSKRVEGKPGQKRQKALERQVRPKCPG